MDEDDGEDHPLGAVRNQYGMSDPLNMGGKTNGRFFADPAED